jgi:UDP-N-acetylmuramate dehydrogenase
MANWRRTVESIIRVKKEKRGVKTASDSLLSAPNSLLYWNEPLFKHTTFRIGGNAECFILINYRDDLQQIIKLVNQENIQLSVIGNGSNLLISQQGIKGITIKLGKSFEYIKREKSKEQCKEFYTTSSLLPVPYFIIGGATHLSKIWRYALTHSLAGVEFLWGIPGSFGGAICTNAGAFSQDIGSKVIQINGFLPSSEAVSLNQRELDFSYRKTKLPNGFILTDGILQLSTCEQNKIIQKIDGYRMKRQMTQPRGASAGSVFKNPNLSTSAGKLIDNCNLKELKLGNAYISKKHGNFIINQNNAHFNDVYELMQIIKSTVELKTGTILEEEIQIFPKK